DTSPESRERRRVRRARALLARIGEQRDRLATSYGHATTPRQRFAAAADALRHAAAATSHQPHPAELDHHLRRVTADMLALVDELHTHHEQLAQTTLRADARRLTTNERRRDERYR